jgi:catechol 2,3-dioxygenase-like lactoylglutathione lyase family enzyme
MATVQLITGVDFVSVATHDLEAATAFYRDVLGLPRTNHHDGFFAEFDTGTVTLSVISPEAFGFEFGKHGNPIAFQVDDVEAARAQLIERGVEFNGDTMDTGVCHMAFFSDLDGNALMLHHRYAPRDPQG